MKESVKTNSDYEQLKRELARALDAFAALQEEHLQEIAGMQIDRVSHWHEGRQRAFERLRTLLERPDGGAAIGADQEFRNSFLRKMQDVLAGEADLRERSSRLQETIGSKLSTARRGRKALQKYSPRGEERPPRFLSSMT